MRRNLICGVAVIAMMGMTAARTFGQGTMVFDGGADGTSWNQANNWNQTVNSDGSPAAPPGDPATPPTNNFFAHIGGNFTVSITAAQGTQNSFTTRVGVGTPGTLNVTGGSLVAFDDITIGQTAKGTVTISAGLLDNGDDFNIDNSVGGDYGSSLTVNGGTVHIFDRLQMNNHGSLVVNAGYLWAEDDFFFFGNSTQTINGGLLEQFDKLAFGDATNIPPTGVARLKINGGIVRTNEWTDNPELGADDLTRFKSIIQVNGTGKLQIEADHFSEALAQALIADGHLTTTSHLTVSSVVVPTFFGRNNVAFTQIAAVPEPSTLALAGLIGLGLLRRRK